MAAASSSPTTNSSPLHQHRPHGHHHPGVVILSIGLVGATFHAWHLDNEKRDVVLLGVFTELMGAGITVSAIL